MSIPISIIPLSKAEIARRLGVSRTYISLLAQGKRKLSEEKADRLTQIWLTANLNAEEDKNRSTNQHIHGPLAQLAEHLTFNQVVTGSRPVRPTLNSLPLF